MPWAPAPSCSRSCLLPSSEASCTSPLSSCFFSPFLRALRACRYRSSRLGSRSLDSVWGVGTVFHVPRSTRGMCGMFHTRGQSPDQGCVVVASRMHLSPVGGPRRTIFSDSIGMVVWWSRGSECMSWVSWYMWDTIPWLDFPQFVLGTYAQHAHCASFQHV